METVKLKFDTEILGESRQYEVEVPCHDGIVGTSEYCPTELMEGGVELLAAVRGVELERFVAYCRMQLRAMSYMPDATSELDRHIGGLMAQVMELASRDGQIAYGDMLTCVDCFSHLLRASGVAEEKVREIYPEIASAIRSQLTESVAM